MIKITDGIINNNIKVELKLIDISDEDNYILEFKDVDKKVILGNTLNLKSKFDWIKYFTEQEKDKKGIIHLNTENVYFEPY